jgi:3-dehydroquinate synthase
VRAILNFGHTFGHAIETALGYGNWLHGEAVAAGMVLAARLSVSQRELPAAELPELVNLLHQCGLPVEAPGSISAEQMLELMQRDKKVLDGRLRLVLLDAIGSACISDDVSREALLDLLSEPR